jgi:ribosomal protein S3AE
LSITGESVQEPASQRKQIKQLLLDCIFGEVRELVFATFFRQLQTRVLVYTIQEPARKQIDDFPLPNDPTYEDSNELLATHTGL